MNNQSFSTNIAVMQSPKEVFDAINNVRGWWSEEVVGETDKLDAEFDYHFQDIHRCTMKITELVPERRIEWLVTDNYFNFIKDQSEWKGTKVVFEMERKNDKTQVRFVHEGLVPQYECYNVCRDAWNGYIQNSLRDLIETGKGEPNPKEVQKREL